MDSADERDDELNAAEYLVEERLSFLKSYSNGLVPDPSENTPIERRAELKKEEEEMKTRIDELERLLKLMRHN